MIEEQVIFFLEKFWFSPQDALLRAFEANLWQKLRLNPPVLDIGCGDGRISKAMFQDRTITVGVDLEYRLVSKAKRCGIYRSVVVTDATRASFKPGSFQTIISNSTFEHIDRDREATAEVARALTKGGLFIFTVPTTNFIRVLTKLVSSQERLTALNRRLNHFHFRSVKDWKDILKKSGLKIEQVEEYFPADLVYPWLRLLTIAIWKPYRRELWSYLKDSPYGRLAPRKLIRWLTERYLRTYLSRNLRGKNCFVMIHARK